MIMNLKSHIDWWSVLEYGLNEHDRNELKDIVPESFELIDCSEKFSLLIDSNVACIVVEPQALTSDQMRRLTNKYRNSKNTIIIMTSEPGVNLQIPWVYFDFESPYDTLLSKAMRVLKRGTLYCIQNGCGDEMSVEYPLDAGFVLVEFETSGLEPETDQIVRFSIMRIKNFRMVDHFETLVRIEGVMTNRAEQLTGITNDMLQDAPALTKVMKSFFEYYPEEPLVFYNSKFCINFLIKALMKAGYSIDSNRIIIDSSYLAKRINLRHFFLNSSNYEGRRKLIENSEIDLGESYIEVEGSLFIHLLNQLRNEYGFTNLREINDLYL